ncbi:hypothetical protein B0H10DRAFT_2192144 [Mycena sp. CBHHK59/15]|nr:hypothetical protein B0H10DRAFT_2192144 [Mycena sp. CBHHK59/15]
MPMSRETVSWPLEGTLQWYRWPLHWLHAEERQRQRAGLTQLQSELEDSAPTSPPQEIAASIRSSMGLSLEILSFARVRTRVEIRVQIHFTLKMSVLPALELEGTQFHFHVCAGKVSVRKSVTLLLPVSSGPAGPSRQRKVDQDMGTAAFEAGSMRYNVARVHNEVSETPSCVARIKLEGMPRWRTTQTISRARQSAEKLFDVGVRTGGRGIGGHGGNGGKECCGGVEEGLTFHAATMHVVIQTQTAKT